MAKYVLDIASYAVGTTPPNLTQRINPYETVEIRDNDPASNGAGGVVEGTPYLFVYPGTDGVRRALTLDDVPPASDFQAYLEFGMQNSSYRDIRVAARLDPNKNTNSETADAVFIGFSDSNTSEFLNTVYTDGVPSSTESPVSGVDSSGIFCLLVTASGSDFEVKIWKKETETEPASPNFTVTNDTNAEGLIGLGSFNGGSFYVHFYGVGTGTDSAPRTLDEADKNPTLTLDQSEVELGGTLTGIAANFAEQPTSMSISDGVSPAYSVTPTVTPEGSDWSVSATIENFAAQAKAAGEGNPIQGLIPGTITVTVE